MRVVSPFSLTIPWVAQPEPCTSSKFTLEDEPDSDPCPTPASTSPGHAAGLDLDPTPSSISDSAMMAPRPPRRRWTLAMAMTDEGVTDEALVTVLERIRLQPTSSGTSDDDKSTAVWDVDQDKWNWNLQWDETNNEAKKGPQPDKIPHTSSLPSLPRQHTLSTPSLPKTITPWKTAQQALLTCRELVRTERHYLASLSSLIASETAAAPPPLMIQYASQLVSVSKSYLDSMEADPSALGVSAAFLSLEETIESAFIGWCGAVGGWFEGSESTSSNSSSRAPSGASSPIRRLSKGRSEENIPLVGAGFSQGSLARALSKRKNVPTMTSLNTSLSPPPSYHSPSSPTPSFKSASFLGWRKDKDRSPLNGNNGTNTKKPLIRDLAILPTQRVVRYVLLYRDLLVHTPSTSPSRPLVMRAVEAATRIAQKCDRAQDNAAFLVNPQNKTAPSRSSTAPKRRNSKLFGPRSRKASAG